MEFNDALMPTSARTLKSLRKNSDWLSDLRAEGEAREAALADLRVILLDGLRHGLINRVNTAGPEFEPLAEDFVQEALLKILDKLESFRGESQFTTWAHKIAVRTALNELRRKRWKDFSLEDMQEGPKELPIPGAVFADPSPGPPQVAEQSEMITHVMRLVDEELTEKQRMAMIATRVNGVPMTVVAEQMGMKRNALYKLLHDARVRLKKRLHEEGLTPEDVLAVFSD